jgi:hypothetical protein
MITWEKFLDLDNQDICRLALLLAMTPTQASEKELIADYHALGYKSAATTISGFAIGSQANIVRNVINMCLNTRILEKKRNHIHPMVHCVLETTQSTRAFDAVAQNFCFKAAVVRKKEQIALCFYGDLAMHELSIHKAVGLGYQILGE